uniref:BZIP domain-containing protein n=1 Tax=Panagrolaimus sp. JU765 TaxID=591449 RepID=A0AC34Q5W3_9BILA
MGRNIIILPAQPSKMPSTVLPRPLKLGMVSTNQRRVVYANNIPQQQTLPVTNAPATRKRTNQTAPVAPSSKRLATAPADDLNSIVELLEVDQPQSSGPRKRQNLNHLSAEERQQRRMMMNRIAAQTARDRKKARSEKLEDAVKQLIAETRYLRGKVVSLEKKLDEANRIIEQNRNSLPSPNATIFNDPQDTGTGIQGSTGMVAGCGADATFYEYNARDNQIDNNRCNGGNDMLQNIFSDKSFAEVADEIDLEELCKELLDDAFPNFENYEVQTPLTQVDDCMLSGTTTDYSQPKRITELPSPIQQFESTENLSDDCYLYEFTNLDNDTLCNNYLDFSDSYPFSCSCRKLFIYPTIMSLTNCFIPMYSILNSYF